MEGCGIPPFLPPFMPLNGTSTASIRGVSDLETEQDQRTAEGRSDDSSGDDTEYIRRQRDRLHGLHGSQTTNQVLSNTQAPPIIQMPEPMLTQLTSAHVKITENGDKWEMETLVSRRSRSKGRRVVSKEQKKSERIVQVIKTFASWKISFDGESKGRRDKAEEFLASVKECMEAIGLSDAEVLEAMPSILTDRARTCEELVLNIVIRNSRPEVRRYLETEDVRTLTEIQYYGKKFEEQLEWDARYIAPPSQDKSRIPGAAYQGSSSAPKKLAATELEDATEQVAGLTIGDKPEAKAPESKPPPATTPANPDNANGGQKGKVRGRRGGEKNENGTGAGGAAETAEVTTNATKSTSTPAPTPSAPPQLTLPAPQAGL
ncbi:hypothetical protein QAD02_008218 [Eretmocerus hayati]|uniref:Uncharacterized protein n=1 Tax=Eretmocerus hayati TaxID=131215 RepID=A0ACC2N6P4_9HYME|nr:hypothetical protein QAD02_008218 [Eretmocerus hayati]